MQYWYVSTETCYKRKQRMKLMANNETKTNAEIYREQRKARLAKAAKKKKHGKHDKLVSVLVKLVCILLVAAIVLYFVGSILTSTFCAPQ